MDLSSTDTSPFDNWEPSGGGLTFVTSSPTALTQTSEGI